MAELYTDFSDVVLADFTNRWTAATLSIETDAGSTGGKFFRVAKAANGRSAVSWDTAGSAADVEIYARLRHNVTRATNRNLNWLTARGAGSGGAEHGYVSSVWYPSTGTNHTEYRGFLINSGSLSVIWELNAPIELNPGVWFKMRFQISGSTLRTRVWADGDPEPSTWTTTTDTEISAAGWIGFAGFNAGNYDYDILGVGTNGDPAPTGPVVAGAPVLSSPSASSITANSIVPNVTLTF